jgi:Zn-dependent protease
MIVLAAFLVLAVIAVAVPGGRQLVQVTFGGALALGVPSGLQAVILLANLAILVNLSLCFFNLFPIPPLDGSRIVRNMMPYNAVQVYDRVPMWVSYLLMILIGPYLLMAMLRPAITVVYLALSHV